MTPSITFGFLGASHAEATFAIAVATTFGDPEMQAIAKLAQKMPQGHVEARDAVTKLIIFFLKLFFLYLSFSLSLYHSTVYCDH